MLHPHPDAPLGTLLHLSSYRASDFPPGSAVLCRNTAPLIRLAYGLLQRDVPCRIAGKDIGAQLATLVRKITGPALCPLPEFREKLRQWAARSIKHAEKEDRNPERIYDQHDCLTFFCESLDESSQTVSSLLAKIDLMFGGETDDYFRVVQLSTIHRAKGSEWRVVFILDFDLMPSRFAKLPWQKVQERNLQYVAITRSLDTLIYIKSDRWKEDEPA